MPGTASFLERHEWIKHGTCFRGAGGADEYFDDTLRVVDAINASEVAALPRRPRRRRGRDRRHPRRASTPPSAPGAGERVQVHCTGDGGRTLIQELTVNLAGAIAPETPVARADARRRPGLARLPARASSIRPGCSRRASAPGEADLGERHAAEAVLARAASVPPIAR